MFLAEILIFVAYRFIIFNMFVDIHTHSVPDADSAAIQNLTFAEAGKVFASAQNGLFSVGFHPWFASEFSEKSMLQLEKWASDDRLALIGECGLDKNSKVPLQEQIDVFQQQIRLSEKIQKPLIIHCVGCFNELFDLKKTIKPQQHWIIHGFRGKPQLAAQALKAGCYLSFGEHFNPESVRLTPIDKLLVETDESSLPIEELYNPIAILKEIETSKLTAGKLIYKGFSCK